MKTKCAYVSLPDSLATLLPYTMIVDEITDLLERGVLLITEKDGQIRQLNHVLRLLKDEKIEVVYVYFGIAGSKEKLQLYTETVQQLQAASTASAAISNAN